MKFIVSSNIDYYQTTTKELINSLRSSGILPESILVSIGRSPDTRVDKMDDVLFHFNAFDCFEYNAVHSMDALGFHEGFFLMHDTCLVGNEFKEKFDSMMNVFDQEKTIALRPGVGGVYANSMGYYPDRYIKIITEKTNYIHTMPYDLDKKREVMSYEDMWFKEDNYGQYFCTEEHNTHTDKLGIRLARYFPELDFIKLQANHAYSQLRMVL